MKPLLQVENLSLRYEMEKQNVLSSLNFKLNRGESVLLLGPSGSGKSTLTSCLNGLFPRELDGEMSGNVFVHGVENRETKPGERSQAVGVVFQDPETQFCMMTVEDEVAFGLENIGIAHQEMEEKIDSALALVNMLPYKKTDIATLSGGQKQKLALACILALKPELIILDEPTANLDPIATRDFISTLKDLKNNLNFGLIVIEHKLDGWTEITERVILLNQHGEIFHDGSIREVIKEKGQQLKEEGIWIPRVTEHILREHPYLQEPPLTVEEYRRNPVLLADREIDQPIKTESNTVPLLEAKDISWTVNKHEILHNISLTFHQGEFVAIVGANGSGKTSLSRMLAGLRQPTTGNLLVHGKPIKQWKESMLRQEIGYVFQNPEHQFITNTVYDEVAFSLQWKDMRPSQVQEKVEEILDTCGLLKLKHAHPFTLSQGQKRRLSVATMLIDNQSLLLLDEPTFGQDAHSNQELMKLLHKKHQTGATLIMITHDMDLIHDYATRVIIMKDGRVVEDCSPSELWKSDPEKLEAWQLTLPVAVQLKNIYEEEVNDVLTTT